MWLVPQLTAFHQSQAEKSIPLGNTFGFRQLREQRLEKCWLCPITLHFSRPLIGGRQATVVQLCKLLMVKCEIFLKLLSVSRYYKTMTCRGRKVWRKQQIKYQQHFYKKNSIEVKHAVDIQFIAFYVYLPVDC